MRGVWEFCGDDVCVCVWGGGGGGEEMNKGKEERHSIVSLDFVSCNGTSNCRESVSMTS